MMHRHLKNAINSKKRKVIIVWNYLDRPKDTTKMLYENLTILKNSDTQNFDERTWTKPIK